MQTPELVLDARAELGEGPVWDERRAMLWWVDIEGRALHRFDPAGGRDETRGFDDMVAAVALAERDDAVLVALAHEVVLYDFDRGRVLTRYGDPEPDQPRTRLNDGKPGPDGRFWVGTLCMEGAAPASGALYSLDARGRIAAHVPGISISNGMGWSEDERSFFYIDSGPRTVDVFTFDAEAGRLADRRNIATLSEADGTPDGMCVDAEGMLWVAHWGGWCVSRWDPGSGECLRTIEVPVEKVTACAFGGPELATLYITTARQGVDASTADRQPYAGGVFAVEPGVVGVPAHRFGRA